LNFAFLVSSDFFLVAVSFSSFAASAEGITFTFT
jgi:hypothetical protein